MNQVINNSGHRRISMAYFAGLFLLTLALSCFAFTRSFKLQQDIPKVEWDRQLKKGQMINNLAELSNLLIQYEDDAVLGSIDAESKVEDKLKEINRFLLHEDTSFAYADIKRIVNMSDNYRKFIKRKTREGDKVALEYEKQLSELRKQVTDADSEKNLAKLKAQEAVIEAKKNGGNAPAPPTIVYSPPSSAGASSPTPAQTHNIPAQNTGDVACDGKISQIRSTFRNMCSSMHSTVAQIQTDVRSISKGILGSNKSEKQRIEDNLKKLNKQLEDSLIEK
jgi:hypothetical protein